MKNYPIYKVKAKYSFPLSNGNQTINMQKGQLGYFKARANNTQAITPSNPEPIFIDYWNDNGQSITIDPKSPVPNGDIYPLIVEAYDILPNIKSFKNNVYSNIDGTEQPNNAPAVVSKTSTSRYVKQSYFVGAFAIVGALNGFIAAKKDKKSTSGIVLTTLVYSAMEALGAWVIASVINEKK